MNSTAPSSAAPGPLSSGGNTASAHAASTRRSLSLRKRGALELQLNDRTALAGSAPRIWRNTRRVAVMPRTRAREGAAVEPVDDPAGCARSSRVTVHHP